MKQKVVAHGRTSRVKDTERFVLALQNNPKVNRQTALKIHNQFHF